MKPEPVADILRPRSIANNVKRSYFPREGVGNSAKRNGNLYA